jgi:hypothetical protein
MPSKLDGDVRDVPMLLVVLVVTFLYSDIQNLLHGKGTQIRSFKAQSYQAARSGHSMKTISSIIGHDLQGTLSIHM